MNLSYALNLPTARGGSATPSAAPGSPESPLSGEFSALLSMLAPVAADADGISAETAAAETGNGLPEESGKFLPVVAGPGLPVAEGEGEALDTAGLQMSAAPNSGEDAQDDAVPGHGLPLAADLSLAALHGKPVPVAVSKSDPAPSSPPALPGKPEPVDAASAGKSPVPTGVVLPGKPEPAVQQHPATAKPEARTQPQQAAASQMPPVRDAAQIQVQAQAQAQAQAQTQTQTQTQTQNAPQAAMELDLDLLRQSQAANPAARQPVAEVLAPRAGAVPAAEALPVKEAAAPEKLMPLSAMLRAQDVSSKSASPASSAPPPVEAGEADASPALRPAREADLSRTAPSKGQAEPADLAQVTAKAAPAPASAPAPAVQQVAAPAATIAVEAPRPAALSNAAPDTAMPTRHDFEAVVDRLAEAREQARPGRADMHLSHREFGNVSVQFEMAGRSLKVAMASDDAAFAPAVQAAMAERPIAALSESGRSENQTARHDTPSQQQGSQNMSQNMSQGSGQSDAQRQDQQSRAAQGRTQGEASQRQSSENSQQSTRGARGARDGDLFA